MAEVLTFSIATFNGIQNQAVKVSMHTASMKHTLCTRQPINQHLVSLVSRVGLVNGMVLKRPFASKTSPFPNLHQRVFWLDEQDRLPRTSVVSQHIGGLGVMPTREVEDVA